MSENLGEEGWLTHTVDGDGVSVTVRQDRLVWRSQLTTATIQQQLCYTDDDYFFMDRPVRV